MSQSPYGEFGNVTLLHNKKRKGCTLLSQSPYGEFGNVTISVKFEGFENEMSQSPYGEFGNVTRSRHDHLTVFILRLSPLTGNLVT